MQKVYINLMKIPKDVRPRAINWFTDTFIEYFYNRPWPEYNAEYLRTAPERHNGNKWWWSDEEHIQKLSEFKEVFYGDIGEW